MKTVLADKKQFIVDASGQPVGVLLDLSSYERLCEAAEENSDIQTDRDVKNRVGAEITRKDFISLDAYRAKRSQKRK